MPLEITHFGKCLLKARKSFRGTFAFECSTAYLCSKVWTMGGVLSVWCWTGKRKMARYNVSFMGAIKGRITSFLGGVKFSKNGVVSTYSTPVNPQTASQQTVRAVFSFLTTAWTQTLTEPQRIAWESARSLDYYKKTDSFTGTSGPYASAKDLFIAMNTNALVAQEALSAPAVTYLVPGASAGIDVFSVTSVVIDASSGTVVITFTGTPTLEQLIFRATPPVSAGTMRVTSVETDYRIVVGPSASPQSAGTQYVALFGPITSQTGKKVFWRLEAIDVLTGRSRLVAQDSTVIVA